MESILNSVKKMIGPSADYDHFEPELITHINSTFMTLTQLGVGPPEGFYIEDDTTTWLEFIPDLNRLQSVKTYMGLKVRLIFDPPASSTVLKAYQDQIKELEWRLNLDVETQKSE